MITVLKKNNLKVFYDEGVTICGSINEELDKAIEKALKPFGYTRWASGTDMVSGVRDLAFERK